MRQTFIATTLALSLAAGSAVAAEKPTPEQLLEDGASKILSAIQLLLLAIPQYEAPVILDNGDILIRRVPRDPRDPEASPPADNPKGKEI
ncbi:MAG: hypothetical protein RIC36_13060 [Rhodospirillales bacterium]